MKAFKYFIFMGSLLFAVIYAVDWVSAQSNESRTAALYRTPDGQIAKRVIINSVPADFVQAAESRDASAAVAPTKLLPVPFSDWSFGTAPTAASMIAGYHDRNGYANIYTGPTNGGVFPITTETLDDEWGYWQDSSGQWIQLNPLSATKNGLDGRTTAGHVDDYWESENTPTPETIDYQDPWLQNNWTEHTKADAVGDFMYSNQWEHGYENKDGATAFWLWDDILECDDFEDWAIRDSNPGWLVDGALGLRNFYESRGYKVTDCYTQGTDNMEIDPENNPGKLYTEGFSFEAYTTEIDAGYPVLLHLGGWHIVVGTGYNDSVTPPVVFYNDVWSYETQQMEWNGFYDDDTQIIGVSVVHLQPHPKNDEIGGAEEITNLNIGTPIEQEVSSASHNPNDPPVSNCGIGAGDATVWYKYTHNAASTAVSFSTADSDYATFIAVWVQGDAGLEPIACNVGGSNPSSVAFIVNNGETFYIEIGIP